ncbi:PASTA domain-containing protein, partial [Ruminococcaceae bacterium OttesenSCG-928-A16]|nr:PASTA domain-containing protein [Ruminococcaceae bacterium OttesenSCG-928-A16]
LTSPDEAKIALAKVNLELLSMYKEEFNDAAPGTVIGQVPEAGTTVFAYTSVRITISKGAEPPPVVMVTVPNFWNAYADDVVLRGAGMGLVVVKEDGGYSNDVAAGYVMGQHTAPDTQVEQGSTVVIVVSRGPAPVSVPTPPPVSTPPVNIPPENNNNQEQG